jgi:hypothetical protein
MPNHSQKYLDVVPIHAECSVRHLPTALSQVPKLSHFCTSERQVCEFPRPPSMGKISCLYRRPNGSPARPSAPTEAFSIMTNSIRFTKCSRVSCIAFVVLVLSIGNPNIAHAGHAVSPNESAGAVALKCFETWLDSPAVIIPAVGCMHRAWQIATCDHSRILTASLAGIVVRDIIMHVLVWMWEFGIPDARPETLRYADHITRPPFKAHSLRIAASAVLMRS